MPDAEKSEESLHLRTEYTYYGKFLHKTRVPRLLFFRVPFTVEQFVVSQYQHLRRGHLLLWESQKHHLERSTTSETPEKSHHHLHPKGMETPNCLACHVLLAMRCPHTQRRLNVTLSKSETGLNPPLCESHSCPSPAGAQHRALLHIGGPMLISYGFPPTRSKQLLTTSIKAFS